MNPILVQTVLFAAFATLASASGATKIYINQVPEYSSLAKCAEPEVSTIVRNMYYGCGDGSKTTSYACFCYLSSSKFSNMIESRVSTACSEDGSQATLAVQVFNDYCQLGEIEAIPTDAPKSTSASSSATPSPSLSQATSTSMSSSLASPASSSATVSVTTVTTSTPNPTITAGSSPKTSSPTAAIAAGVTIPIFGIAFAIAGFFVWRRRSQAKRSGIELSDGDRGFNTIEVYPKRPSGAYELKEESIVEIGESERRAEPIDLTKVVQRHELEVRQ